MAITENKKLIYQIYNIARSSVNSMGLIYYKEYKDESHSIWARRAFKKGYVDLVSENESYYLFKINDKGIKLLKNYPQYHLHNDLNSYNINNYTVEERRKLRRERIKL